MCLALGPCSQCSGDTCDLYHVFDKGLLLFFKFIFLYFLLLLSSFFGLFMHSVKLNSFFYV